jgi:hypothetical protein
MRPFALFTRTTIFLSALGTGIVGTEVGLGFQITTPTAD